MMKKPSKAPARPPVSGGFGGNGTPAVIDGRYMNLAPQANPAQGGYNPEQLNMDDGTQLDTHGMSGTGLEILGHQAHDKYRQHQLETWMQNGSDPSHPPQVGASPAGGQWDAYSGFMRGRMLGNQAQGKQTRIRMKPQGWGEEIDTRFDPDQVDAGSGNTLLQDAQGQDGHHPAVVALIKHLTRGGR